MVATITDLDIELKIKTHKFLNDCGNDLYSNSGDVDS